MQKIKPVTFTARTVKDNSKGTIERFAASENAFSFMSSIKKTPVYWKQLLHNGKNFHILLTS